MATQLGDDIKRCPTHTDTTYGKLEQCPKCRVARSIAVKAASPKADTHELELRENEYRADGKFLRRIAREWLEEGTARERGIAIKAFDAAVKYERIALEIRQQRIEIEHDQWLVEQKRLLGGRGN